jgi:hypothetical protein
MPAFEEIAADLTGVVTKGKQPALPVPSCDPAHGRRAGRRVHHPLRLTEKGDAFIQVKTSF